MIPIKLFLIRLNAKLQRENAEMKLVLHSKQQQKRWSSRKPEKKKKKRQDGHVMGHGD